MATKKHSAKRASRVKHGVLVKAVARKATAKAMRDALRTGGPQLMMMDGWLVRVDEHGQVVERVEYIGENRSLGGRKLP